MKNLFNWKKVGLTVIRKLVYYASVLIFVVLLGSLSADLLTAKDTFQNAIGLILAAGVIGGTVAVGAREVNQIFRKIDNNNN